MQKILVTGGSGFIGSYVVERLLEDGREVIVLDRTVPDHKLFSEYDGVERMLGDIRDDVAVTEAMAHADGFIHLAGVLGTKETINNPRPAAYTNILGGLNVLEAAVQYGVPGINIAVGNYWMNNTYSITKSTMERFVQMFAIERKARIGVVRALNAYGPRQSVAAPYGPSKVRKIMPSFIMRALNDEPIEVYGNGSQIMDMIYVRDVANVLVDALYHQATLAWGMPEILEAGTGVPTTVLDVAEAVVNEVGRGEIKFEPMRPGEPENSVVLGDPATLKVLYEEPELLELYEGIRRTVEYYRVHY